MFDLDDDQRHWALAAHVATLILRGLPGSTVACGRRGSGRPPADYITPTPNGPLMVFGPDGRFIVNFVGDGTWLDAEGRKFSTSGMLEGGPESIAKGLIHTAGLTPGRGATQHVRNPRSDRNDSAGLRRLLKPLSTNTWRDQWPYPEPPHWPNDTPPSMCLPTADTRFILATYQLDSCTFTAGTPQASRWGVESLRVPAIPDTALRDGFLAAPQQIHPGDCVATVGPKFGNQADELDFDDDISGETLIWHPQLVLHVEPEGLDHLRVWLLVDHHVANEHTPLSALGTRGDMQRLPTGELRRNERAAVLAEFHLNVFCRGCGNRGRPIMYGLPDLDFPDYYAIGGCLVEPDQPEYVCACGNQWNDAGTYISDPESSYEL